MDVRTVHHVQACRRDRRVDTPAVTWLQKAQLSGQDDVNGQGKDYERDHREKFADGSLPLNAVAALLRVGLNFRCIV
ncbi:hypothetical protein ACFC96_12745 [Streptomyces sp. NPDC055955]|uniref:hypothetical protein n=1 Tax=Streptomyces sp. NPDC055955 TaxID=3345665 RepID=UPI0035DC01F7